MPPAVIEHGFADAPSRKGEDCPDWHPATAPDAAAAYAIFDGHGGKLFSHTCGRTEEHGPDYNMLKRLLAAGGARSLPSDEVVRRLFWSQDEDVGTLLASRGEAQGGPNTGGSTAQVLMLLPQPGVGVQCLQAWVGDSTALTVDMRSGGIVHATLDHTPYQQSEYDALMLMAAVCKACRKKIKKARKKDREATAATAEDADAADNSDDDDDGTGAAEDAEDDVLPTTEMIGQVLSELKHTDGTGAHIERLLQALAREKLIGRYLKSSGKYRRDCHIYRRPKEKDANQPLTVHTTEDPFRKHHSDMMMTRSLGDWSKVAWILPAPETRRATVGAHEHVRIVLASDGLWDVVSHEEAADLTRRAPTAQAAAQALVDAAKFVYLEERGLALPGDDTTVLVVEINPSRLPFKPVRKQGCAVM